MCQDLTPIKNEEKLKLWSENTLSALDHIHKKGVIHVDLKLENLLLKSSERDDEYPIAKLCDFGLCHILDQNNGKAFMEVLCGTQGYFAPEQKQVFRQYLCTLLQKSWVGTEIDMWSFGVMLYEMTVAYKPTAIKNYRYNTTNDIPFWHSDWKKKDKRL